MSTTAAAGSAHVELHATLGEQRAAATTPAPLALASMAAMSNCVPLTRRGAGRAARSRRRCCGWPSSSPMPWEASQSRYMHVSK